MNSGAGGGLGLLIFSMVLRVCCQINAETFRVATYNIEGYLDQPTQNRSAKSPESKAKVRESIRAINPDVLALQELGSRTSMMELQAGLKAEGLDLPYCELVAGSDTNIHVAVLSRFPLTARRPHTNDQFLLDGRRFHVSRGFAEVDIRVNKQYSFTLITAHLKSKRLLAQADEADLRLEEAKLLREKIDARLAADPRANLVVLGDLNDTKDALSTRTIIGRGKHKLVDTCPAERNADSTAIAIAGLPLRKVTWTYYYEKSDTYSRIDFVLVSTGMAREWNSQDTYVLALPGWGTGSDHRPLVASFEAQDQ